MKVKQLLEFTGISREHLSRLVKQGKIRTTKLPNGYYDYKDDDVYSYAGKTRQKLNIIYARVSTGKQKNDLVNQLENLEKFCAAQGFTIHRSYFDIASGIDFEKRKYFFEMLDLIIDRQVNRLFITYKDRLSRVGFGLFKHLFNKFGTEIIVINETGNEKLDSEEIFNEIISLIHCFSMKHYSKRRLKKIAEVLDIEKPESEVEKFE
jgi:predicted site-specific integrase-resolvase